MIPQEQSGNEREKNATGQGTATAQRRGKKGLMAGGKKTTPKPLFNGSFLPMLEANQEDERGCRVPGARSLQLAGPLPSWSHPDGAQRGILVAPWRMGWELGLA